MTSRILGTGLSGLVGSRIVELLNDFEFEDLPIESGFDITKKETIEKKIASSEAESIIHLAAFTDVGAAFKETGYKDGLCYRVNVIGTKNITELCRKYNKFLIHFSTDFIFDGEKDEPYVEQDKPNPIDWYGQTKYWAEETVKASGCNCAIVRIAYPFRANYGAKADLIKQLVESIKDKTIYPQFIDKIITPTFIDDIVSGIGIILRQKPKGIFHLTGSSYVSHFELAKKVARTFGLDKSLVKEGSLIDYRKANPNSRPYPRCLKISNQKAGKILGIKMKTIDEALLKLL